MGIKVEKIDLSGIEGAINALTDDSTMLEIHNQYAKFLDPYVPMDEGNLAHNLTITPEYVQYNSPYAHYQYTGMVYGPNIPIMQNGVIVGYFSPPNQQKHPTGAMLQYSSASHPLATREWDKAAMQDKGDVFTKDVQKIVEKKLKGG